MSDRTNPAHAGPGAGSRPCAACHDAAVTAHAAVALAFPGLPQETIRRLDDPERLTAGKVLCREGEPADCAWLVVGGRLRVHRRQGHVHRTVGEVGPGEVVGESVVEDGGLRRATVVARRDSLLVPVSPRLLADVISDCPEILSTFLRTAGRRSASRRETPVLTVVPAGGTEAVVDRLVERWRGWASTHVLDLGAADRTGEVVVASPLPGMGRVVVVGDLARPEETDRAVDLADEVAVVCAAASPGADPVLEHLARIGVRNRTAVFVHPSGTRMPAGSREWRAAHPGVRLLHLRDLDREHDDRVARLLAGLGVTLVLGGGGGRSMAEIGVHEELQRLGIPVDAVTGTSAGAVIGAGIASGYEGTDLRDASRSGFAGVRDPTIPAVGLLRGERLWNRLTDVFGDTDIEDLWLPYGCMATDLTAGTPVGFTEGPLRNALRASVSVPGVFPPFDHDGHLHVDGGLMDNVPVRLAEELVPDGIRIAVDVAPPNGPEAPGAPHSVSGVRLLVDRLLRRRPSELPSLATTMTQAMLLGAASRRAEARQRAHLHLDLPMEDHRLLDFGRVDLIADAGAQRARPLLHDWLRDRGDALLSDIRRPAKAIPDPPPLPVPTRAGAFSGALWLALADLRFRLRRFVVAVVAAGVTLALLLLMTGVVNQFDREPGATAATLGASHWVLPAGIENPFTSNATFPADVAAQVVVPPGEDGAAGQANAVVLARLPLTVDGETLDAILVGHPPTGPGAPEVDGVLAVGPDGVAVSRAVPAGLDEQIELGGRPVRVVGLVDDATLFAGMPLVFVPVEVARQQLAGGAAFASAFLADGAPTAVPAGMHVLTASEVAEAAKGPVERPILTLHIVRALLAIVAAMIIGAVVYLASIERTRDVAVLRAVGVEGSMLATGVAAQALAMAIIASLGAIALQVVMAPVFPLAVYLTATDLVLLPVLAAGIAMAASYAAIRRTLRIEPSAAFAAAGG